MYDLAECTPIEGKFGQSEVKYGMDQIKSRMKDSSESWFSTILVVMNLVRSAKEAILLWHISEERSLEEVSINGIRDISNNRLPVMLIAEFR